MVKWSEMEKERERKRKRIVEINRMVSRSNDEKRGEKWTRKDLLSHIFNDVKCWKEARNIFFSLISLWWLVVTCRIIVQTSFSIRRRATHSYCCHCWWHLFSFHFFFFHLSELICSSRTCCTPFQDIYIRMSNKRQHTYPAIKPLNPLDTMPQRTAETFCCNEPKFSLQCQKPLAVW